MLGLVAIIVIFIFIGLIYLMFAGKPDQGSLTRDITQVGKAQNILDSFVQITPCYATLPYEQMDNLIKECYTSAGSSTACGEPCKDYIAQTMDEMVKAYNPDLKYEFKILIQEEEFLSQGACPAATKEERVATENMPAGKDILTLKITYCIQ